MKKILIIDDDAFVRKMTAHIIKQQGFDVLLADNGNKGIQLLEENLDLSLIITDILMPDKEGLETISDIKKINKHIKVIAMSGGGATSNMNFLNLAEKVGANTTLKKPFTPKKLLSAVNELI